MAYEYEGKLLDYASDSKTYEEYKAMTQELQEVYRKAKAFDAIIDIEDDFVKYHGFYPCVEEYAEEVEDIISEYMERADDER
ncbi:hypothetical protein QI290_03340 [Staphylococcus saprophyticus]|nr:hypothetical protein [Staphylococcus saprophyticus]